MYAIISVKSGYALESNPGKNMKTKWDDEQWTLSAVCFPERCRNIVPEQPTSIA